jgi:hypothetical protein
MPAVAARIELELQRLKFGALGKVWVACAELRRWAKEEGIAHHRSSPAQQRRAGLLACLGASYARAANREAFGQQVR